MNFPILLAGIEGFAQFLTAILIFLFVLLITYFTTRLIGNFQKNQFAYRNFEAIESFRITNGKYLQLVKVGDRYIVLGIGKDSVSMICELSPDEVKLVREGGGISKDTFRELFAKERKSIGGRDNSHEE